VNANGLRRVRGEQHLQDRGGYAQDTVSDDAARSNLRLAPLETCCSLGDRRALLPARNIVPLGGESPARRCRDFEQSQSPSCRSNHAAPRGDHDRIVPLCLSWGYIPNSGKPAVAAHEGNKKILPSTPADQSARTQDQERSQHTQARICRSYNGSQHTEARICRKYNG
jgi:hypothetical protein